MKTLPTTCLRLLAVLCLLVAVQAQAQTVWRCGADGRSFSDRPCAEGRALDPETPRPAADIAAAQARSLREQQLAAQLTRERLHQEAVARGSGYAGIPLAASTLKPAARPLATRRNRPPRRERPPEEAGIWRATVPASRRAPD